MTALDRSTGPCKRCGALFATDCGRIACPQAKTKLQPRFEKFATAAPREVEIRQPRFNNTGDSPLHREFETAAAALALSPEERAVAWQWALETPAHALECYAAIARSVG